MKNLGLMLVILGILLSLFTVVGCEGDGSGSWLDWVNNWGEGAAWVIRIGFIAVGLVLMAVADKPRSK